MARTQNTTSDAVDSPSFEDSLAELQKIVEELESGDIPLDRSLQLYEQGTRLSRQCQERLQKAEERIEALARDSGSATALSITEEEEGRPVETAHQFSDDDIPF